MTEKISCVCMYHGRNWVVREAVESFLRQDYDGPRELLIFNDCPEQPVECDAPNVRCVNLDRPITNLSAKFDAACAAASGEYVAWWEDDDISMPWRLSLSAGRIGYAVMYKQSRAPWVNGEGIQPPAQNLFMGSALHRRDIFLQTSGETGAGWVDQGAWARLNRSGLVIDERASNADMYFLYRWDGQVHHDSGVRCEDPAERFRRFHAATVADRRFVRGKHTIRPAWRQDYVKLWQAALPTWPEVQR